jgi:hypothetical protein
MRHTSLLLPNFASGKKTNSSVNFIAAAIARARELLLLPPVNARATSTQTTIYCSGDC